MEEETQVSTVLRRQMERVNGVILNTLEQIFKIAEKGPVNLMLSMGACLIVIGLLFKIEIAGQRIASLSLGEFITIFAVGFLFIVGAAAIRVYQFYVTTVQTLREQEKLGAELLKKTFETAAELAKQKSNSIIL